MQHSFRDYVLESPWGLISVFTAHYTQERGYKKKLKEILHTEYENYESYVSDINPSTTTRNSPKKAAKMWANYIKNLYSELRINQDDRTQKRYKEKVSDN